MDNSLNNIETMRLAKPATINFDCISQDILRNVDPLMRETLINVGVRLVAESPMYSQYMVNTPDTLNTLNTLNTPNILTQEQTTEAPSQDTQTQQVEQKEETVSWDNF